MAEKIENNRIEQGFYSYPDTSAADRAAAEVERISRLEEQIDYSKPKVVHLLYDRINDSNVFATPEGFAYLLHLREFLEENSSELDHEIKGIPSEILTKKVNAVAPEAPEAAEVPEETVHRDNGKIKKIRRERDRYKNLFFISRIVAVALGIAVIVMFIIALNSSAPNILNYERAIQDKYAAWENTLNERERAVAEREKAVGE